MVKVLREGVRLDDGTIVSYRQMALNSHIREQALTVLRGLPDTYVPAQKLIARIERFNNMLSGISYIQWTGLTGGKTLYQYDPMFGLQKQENGAWKKSQRQLHEFLMHDNTKEVVR